MHLLCQFDRHQPSACEIWNDGYFFSFCENCGTDLVCRPNRRWRSVRPSEKIVWKPRQPFDMPWHSQVVPQPPSDAVPVTAEWRALIDRNRQGASNAPVRPRKLIHRLGRAVRG